MLLLLLLLELPARLAQRCRGRVPAGSMATTKKKPLPLLSFSSR